METRRAGIKTSSKTKQTESLQSQKKDPSLQSEQSACIPETIDKRKDDRGRKEFPPASDQKKKKIWFLIMELVPAWSWICKWGYFITNSLRVVEQHLCRILKENLVPRNAVSIKLPFECNGNWKML